MAETVAGFPVMTMDECCVEAASDPEVLVTPVKAAIEAQGKAEGRAQRTAIITGVASFAAGAFVGWLIAR